MHTQLEESVAERASITEVPESHSGNPLSDPAPGRPVPKAPEPVRERLAAVRAGIDENIPLSRHRASVALKLLFARLQKQILPLAEHFLALHGKRKCKRGRRLSPPAATARKLGITREGLYKKMERLTE